MIITVILYTKAPDSKNRVKSVIHFDGSNMAEIEKQISNFKMEFPEYTLGAYMQGYHTTIP